MTVSLLSNLQQCVEHTPLCTYNTCIHQVWHWGEASKGVWLLNVSISAPYMTA